MFFTPENYEYLQKNCKDKGFVEFLKEEQEMFGIKRPDYDEYDEYENGWYQAKGDFDE